MKKHDINKRLLGVLLIFLSFFNQTNAQLSISAQIRPRGEVRNGLSTLKIKDTPSAGFISQRSRLSFLYKLDKVAFGMSVQDVRVCPHSSLITNYLSKY